MIELLVFILLISTIIAGDDKLFTGLIAASFTPFDGNHNVNVSVIPEYAKYLSKRHVNGVFVSGSTGESLILTLEERKQLAEKWVEEGHKVGLKIIIHVGAQSLHDSVDLAKHAQKIKADGIGYMSSSFFKPSSPQVLYNMIKTVADAADEIPLLYYHIPGMTGINVDVVEFFKLVVDNINTFHGIKFTDRILNDVTAIQSYLKKTKKDHISILFGADEQFDSAYYMGVDGGVGSTYNYASEVYYKVMKAIDDKDFSKARKWQSRSEQFIRIFASYAKNNVYANKALAELTMKIHLGDPRLPYKPISKKDLDEMNKALEAIDYFKWYDGEDDDDDDDDEHSHNTWLIIGGTLGAVIVLIILGVIIWKYTSNKNKSNNSPVNDPLIQT